MKSLSVAFFLALKSIIRGNAGVTLLTIAMLTLANLNLLFVPSMIDGIVDGANSKLIRTYSGNIIVQSADDTPVIRQADELVRSISGIPGVIGVTARNSIGAEIYFEGERTNCTVRAIAPDREKTVFDMANMMIEGSYLEERDTGEILLGAEVSGSGMTKLELYSGSLKKVHAGDKVQVTFGNGVKKQYRVKGIYYTEFIQSDFQAFITQEEFKSINPLVGDTASVINIKIADDRAAPAIINEIKTRRDKLKFMTWRDMAGIVQSMTDSFAIIKGILTAVNLLIAGITVFIVTYVDLAHKRRQIGIERAIGIASGAISLTYVLRAVFYALVAIGTAWLLYTYVVTPVEARYPFHFPFGEVFLVMTPYLLLSSSLTIFGVSLLAAFLPVWQTLRIRILDAIWG